MYSSSDKVLEKVVDAIVREVDPEQVYLFGSEARGEATADSACATGPKSAKIQM